MKAIIEISKNLFIIATLSIILVSCGDDLLNTDTTEYATLEQINEKMQGAGDNIDGIVALLNATMSGAYNAMITYQGRHDSFGEMSTGLSGDLMTEDVVMNYRTHFIYDYDIDNNAATYARPTNTWNYLYLVVSACNEIIEKVQSDVESPKLQGILGEALALRAYAFHTLIQRYQQTYKGNETAPGIPLNLTENDDRPKVRNRGTVEAVYDKILTDYEKAVELLSNAPARANKALIDKNVASGLFARALMVVGDWTRAAEYARQARQGYTLMDASEIVADGFNNINNKEWIWGADITSETTTMFASFFSHVCSYDVGYAESTFAPKLIDARLYGQMSATDVRKAWFKAPDLPVDGTSPITEVNAPSYCNFKFKKVDGWLADYIYMRASEMYLIEAEALAQQNRGSEAATILNELMDKRDPAWAANHATATVEDVFLNKRIELWAEGHIFYDYLRLKKGVERDYPGSNHMVKQNQPAGSWKFIYQIPQAEMDNNDELTEQDQNKLS